MNDTLRWSQFVDAVSRVTTHVRADGRELKCSCPSTDHADRDPSFSASLDADGHIRFCCHSRGCTDGVLSALGWTWADLRPDDHQTRPVEPRPASTWVDPAVLHDWHAAAHRRLLSDPSDGARAARRYLRSRGVDGDLVRRYGFGFATDDAPDRRLAMLRNRLTICEWPHHAEGRVIPGVDGAVYPDVKWLSAKGSTKQWWRAGDVDPTLPVLLVEGAFDVLGADRITAGNTVAILSKTNAKAESAQRLAQQGVTDVYVSLDADADEHQWRRVLAVCAETGMRVRPVVGPDRGDDWGDLLPLADDYYVRASDAMCSPPRVGAEARAA